MGGLTPGTAYGFAVHANNAVGSGPEATVSATTHAVPEAPVAPSVTKGKKGGAKTARVTWSSPASTGGLPISGYQVLAYRIRHAGRAA